MALKRELLEEKRKQLHILIQEIRVLEEAIIKEEWEHVQVCSHSYEKVSQNMCKFGITVRGIVFCKHPNCRK